MERWNQVAPSFPASAPRRAPDPALGISCREKGRHNEQLPAPRRYPACRATGRIGPEAIVALEFPGAGGPTTRLSYNTWGTKCPFLRPRPKRKSLTLQKASELNRLENLLWLQLVVTAGPWTKRGLSPPPASRSARYVWSSCPAGPVLVVRPASPDRSRKRGSVSTPAHCSSFARCCATHGPACARCGGLRGA
jgi:hypothetical protein